MKNSYELNGINYNLKKINNKTVYIYKLTTATFSFI